MFKLHKNRPAKSGERVDFKFSHFKALQVPRGWDKLFVSIVSIETGKPIAKSSKAVVRNGNCQWTETLSESIWISQDDSSKEMEDYFFKLVLSMGSARSGILGEATVNMSDYINSTSSVPVSLPLKKCTYGTVLQVKINCLTPRKRLGDEESKETSCHFEEPNASGLDVDSKSNGSNSTFGGSIGSSSMKDFGLTSNPGEPGSRGSSFSASGSHNSYDSAEGSIRRDNMSPGSNLSGEGNHLIGRQDSTNSPISTTHGNYPTDAPSPSNHSSFNSRINHSQNSRKDFTESPLRITDSSKNLLEAAEFTIEELHAEAKMWERNARKLMLDLEILRTEFSDQSKKQANLNVELSAAYAERDGLKKEVEHLQFLFENSVVKQTGSEDLTSLEGGTSQNEKALQDELKFQKESVANLALQLERSQESNIELVSVLQELEETIEKQKVELENLSELQSKFGDMENSIKITTEENRNLKLQLQKLQESENKLQVMMQQLEQALEEKNHEIEDGSSLNKQTLLDIETEYKSKLFFKEQEIVKLKAKLSESLQERHSAEMDSITMNGGEADLIREIEVLKEKVEELERDCNELTDENLELLFKLKVAKKNSTGGHTPVDLPASEVSVTENKSQIQNAEEKFNKKVLGEITNNNDLSVQVHESLKMELEIKVTELGKELTENRSEIAKLEANLLTKEEEIGVLRQVQNELEAKVSDLQTEKIELEEQMEIVLRESDISSKCLNDLRNELTMLSSSVNSHVSSNKVLERKSSELEADKCELDLHVSELEQENIQLSAHISALEAQQRYLTDEKEANQLELDKSKSYCLNLQDEISRLKIEMKSDKVELKQKLKHLESQWSEAREECEYLKRANPKLQATAESLIEECNSLQKSNEELKKQKLELQEQCSLLEAKLNQLHKSFTDCSKRVEVLEKHLSLMLENIASKEESLNSELDALLDENMTYREKLTLEESLFNEMYLEKATEVESLQQEVEQLTKKISATKKEREQLASDAIHEASRLRAEKAMLESALQEVQSKAIQTENELNVMRTETEPKLQGLSAELAASKQNQESTMADHERLLKMFESYKSSEAKLQTTVNDLELKLTVSDYERQQLVEESTNLKVQLQKLTDCQNEVLAFKNELDAATFEKEKLEALLHSISEECDDLKAEKSSFHEKISTLEKALFELEDCKRNTVLLEEKILQMEGDLIAKEALCAQDAELKNELNQIRRANEQYQQKIKLLEEERSECLRRSQALEQELKLTREERQKQRDSSSPKISSPSKNSTKVIPVGEDMKLPKNEMAKNSSHRRDSRRKPFLKTGQVQGLAKDQNYPNRNQYQREDDNGNEIRDGSPRDAGVDYGLKIKFLEDELVKALEANNTYKVQLDRMLSEARHNHSETRRNSKAEAEKAAKERYERSRSSLETELKDIRERYLHMSLRYAEVEAQREELVMKLKAAKGGKRWFS
ncbi:intracellular protein transport protein USO1-like [Prunus avium]|uniref:Intracellular protein transport protein USO1-like n=1 Tax=Prunus avium TaxID=42229 RepID=A0A6P5TUP5_PRUAV|nr:intracellular protein transport protein USO1-like [Prunus avium]